MIIPYTEFLCSCSDNCPQLQIQTGCMIRFSRRLSKLGKKFFCNKAKQLTEAYKLSEDEIDDILMIPKDKKSQVSKPKQESAEVGITELKYGLPIINQPFPIVMDEEELRVTVQTPTQNLYALLKLNELTSWSDYETALKQTYHNQVDMYGNEQPPAHVGQLQFMELLRPNSSYLVKLRSYHTINYNIPGTLQCDDPNNFLTLRPVEEFRHTPLIPISDSAMKKHKEMLEEYHRRAFVFEISHEKIWTTVMFFVAAAICGYLVKLVFDKEEQAAISHQRTKYKRILGEESQTKGNLI